MTNTSALDCEIASRCGGCPWYAKPLVQQHADKRAALASALGGLAEGAVWHAFFETPSLAFRDRLDLRLNEGRLGLLGQEGDGVVDMERCPIATDEVNAALGVLRADLPPAAIVERSSVRLRARGARVGVWLDLPHLALKGLLDEASWLRRATARGWVVELGPKGRRYDQGLVTPTLMAWSETFVDGPIDLHTTVMGFSQPGAAVNRALVRALLDAVDETDASSALELGAGAGNLTLPLASRLDVVALELDIAPLMATMAHAGRPGLVARISPRAGSFHREAEVPELVASSYHGHPVDLIVCDPPRSGLGTFLGGLGTLSKRLRPAHLVYVSCHPEALAKDAARLGELGYRLRSLRGVDQFPWTPHAEWVARFER